MPRPTYFASAAEFRRWLKRNHAKSQELLVGFHRRETGRPSMTWPESVDEALSFGWIDGVRKRIDEVSYTIRFTPRRASSIWSAINIARMAELEKLGKLTDAGRAAFARKSEKRTARYSFENAPRQFDPADEKRFRANRKAWAFFSTQAPSYQRVATFWVTSAVREETRQRRLNTLIEDSANGRRIGILEKKKK